VALEMFLSHDFITPTINGVNYMNKPPLYNWILVLFANLGGGFSEFMLRLPATISLLVFGLTVYLFVKKEYGKRFAMINALMIITCGRVLFWESFFSIIDFSFSVAVYAGIMFIYFYHKRDRFLLMFIVSYVFAAVAFMLKGLPAIVFQGITLIVLLVYEKKVKKLFTIEHLIGIAVFVFITGSYYLIYIIKNPGSSIFSVLLDESIKRTVVQFNGFHVIRAMLRFPFDMIYHYLPWSAFIVSLFKKRFWKEVNNEPFLKFNLLIFLSNLLVYWTSPDVYPKYILMLMPMFFTVVWYFARKSIDKKNIKIILMEKFVMVLMVIFSFGPFIFPLFKDIQFINHYYGKAVFLILINLFILYLFIKLRKQRIILTIIFLLLIRIAFDWFIWPIRFDKFTDLKKDAIEVAKITNDKSLYIYTGSNVDRATSFYITREKEKIIRFKCGKFSPDEYCIIDKENLNELKMTNQEYVMLYIFETLPTGDSLYLTGFKP
jgi:4-amino-4-deoxy-L-arabinose transferase-like glycosyltransferase